LALSADESTEIRLMANAIRALSMDAVEKAKSGHPGMPMGMADVATALFTRFLKFDPAQPLWADRDRFVLSAGHGSMLLYSLLHLTGYADMTLEELKQFRQLGARTAGHPEFGHASGVETTTGPLGQGIANAVGMAIAEKMLAARFGADLVDHRTWVIAGDGCLMEGVSHEAISLAGHLKLNKLIVLWDDNQISIDGATSLTVSDDQHARFSASGWTTLACDGHDPAAIVVAMQTALASDKPVMIACRTTIGFGAPNKGGTSGAHGSPLGGDEIAKVRVALDWPHAPFEIPADLMTRWRAAGSRGAPIAAAWAKRLAADPRHGEFTRMMTGGAPAALAGAFAKVKADLAAMPKVETRRASGMVIEAIGPAAPELIGGSADLTGSNLTKAKSDKPVTAADFSGRYVYWGVREHGMAAAMNGMALHGGFTPFGGTFLVFTDYCRPSIRLAALMGLKVVYVMTHDSIGLGEDGPTHQAVEHLASLRAIPGLAVFRPADGVETAECWQAALACQGPSVLALTRQGVPTLRAADAENKSALGAYVLSEPKGKRQATILATGSEVSVAVEAAALLAQDGISAAVVSMPSWELFAKQDSAYRASVMGNAPRVAVEAASGFGWERWVGAPENMIGMNSFGASAPAEELYKHFGITAAAVAARVKTLVK
jgi:transketolase